MKSYNQPDIIFIVIDTCRADTFFQLLDEGKLPNLHSVFQKSIEYRQAISVAPWTVPSHGSLFTGLYPLEHGTSANKPNFKPPRAPIAEKLQNVGYRTIGISANPWISPSYNFDKGFERFKTAYDYFWEGAEKADLQQLSSRLKQFLALWRRLSVNTGVKTIGNIIYEKTLAKRYDSGARQMTRNARKILEKKDCKPKFLFLNYMEPHLDYNPPDSLAIDELPSGVTLEEAYKVNQNPWKYIAGQCTMNSRDFDILRSLYRAEIRYLDSQLGILFDVIRENGSFDDTAIIIVGDHGENIGEHNLMDHQYCLYQTLLHVPLAIKPPKSSEHNQINRPIETRHVFNTICGMVDVGTETSENTSLLDPERLDYKVISEYPEPQPSIEKLENRVGTINKPVNKYNRSLRSIQVNKWKLIEGSDNKTELYNLKEDPNEQNPVTNKKKKDKLMKMLKDKRGEIKIIQGEGISDQNGVQNRLEDLGYL